MKLCRTVTLTAEGGIDHAVSPLGNLELVTSQLLAGPVKLSFDRLRIAALVESPDLLSPDFIVFDDVQVVWSLLITDHVDRQPLFSNISSARALLLVGEIVDNLIECLDSLGHHVHSVAPNLKTNHLVVNFTIEKGSHSRVAIGSALCLATILDGLLFVRGLDVSSSMVSIFDEGKIGRLEFVNLYRSILTESYGPTFRNSALS